MRTYIDQGIQLLELACNATEAPHDSKGTKTQVAGNRTTCPVLLPRLDEYRTYCYEHEIREIPDLLSIPSVGPTGPQ